MSAGRAAAVLAALWLAGASAWQLPALRAAADTLSRLPRLATDAPVESCREASSIPPEDPQDRELRRLYLDAYMHRYSGSVAAEMRVWDRIESYVSEIARDGSTRRRPEDRVDALLRSCARGRARVESIAANREAATRALGAGAALVLGPPLATWIGVRLARRRAAARSGA